MARYEGDSLFGMASRNHDSNDRDLYPEADARGVTLTIRVRDTDERLTIFLAVNEVLLLQRFLEVAEKISES